MSTRRGKLYGLPPLAYVYELSVAAQAHVDDMAANDFTGHTGSGIPEAATTTSTCRLYRFLCRRSKQHGGIGIHRKPLNFGLTVPTSADGASIHGLTNLASAIDSTVTRPTSGIGLSNSVPTQSKNPPPIFPTTNTCRRQHQPTIPLTPTYYNNHYCNTDG